jgi:gliding motility-associated-like protein
MKTVTNTLLVALFSLIAISNSFGQSINMQDGIIYTCGSDFYDFGGPGGDYNNNESYTLTICPDTEDGRTSVTFNSFLSEAGSDQLTVYNSNGTNVLMQIIDGGTALPAIVTATNKTGCLTFVWTSNAGITNAGWDADIICAACKPVVPILASSVPAANNPGNIIGVCNGAVLSLSGGFDDDNTGAYNQIGAESDYYWDLGDGTTKDDININHTYAAPGIYYANLMIRDNAGCRNSSLLNQEIHVADDATFVGTTPDQVVCEGGKVNLTAVYQQIKLYNTRRETNLTDVTLIDGRAECKDTDLEVNFYASGATYSVGDITRVYVSMWHKDVNDLVLMLTAPSGASIKLHNQASGTSTTTLGNPSAAAVSDYYFNNDNSGNTWDEAVNSPTFNIAPGTYKPLEPLSNLYGSKLNGTWTLTVCDMEGNAKDGFIDAWGIDFDNANFSPRPEYVPGSSAYPNSIWSGPNVGPYNETLQTIEVTPQSPLETYTFTLENEYGCTKTTSVDVITETTPVAGADATDDICGTGIINIAAYLSGQDNSSGSGYWVSGPNNPDGPSVIPQSAPNDQNASWDASGAATGIYEFIYRQPGVSCDGDSAIITLNVTKLPLTGNRKDRSFCINEENPVLFLETLTSPKDSTGTWIDVNTTGALTDPTAFDTELDIIRAGVGGHDFTYEINTTPCPVVSVTVTVTIEDEPNAGDDGSETVCKSSTGPFDLFSVITGFDLGGEWYFEDKTRPTAWYPTPGVYNEVNPNAVANGVTGDYVFMYIVGNGSVCDEDTAFATLTISEVAAAGNTMTVDLCTSDDIGRRLYSLNSGEPGGTWTPSLGNSDAYNAADTTFTPSNDPDPATPVTTLTYDHEQTAAGCPPNNATLTINLHRQPNAGTFNVADTVVCQSNDVWDMFSNLGGNPNVENGTWEVLNPANASAQGYFNTSANGDDWTYDVKMATADGTPLGLDAGNSYRWRYTVASTGGGCVADFVDMLTKISIEYDPGKPTNFTVCGDDPAINLFQEAFLLATDLPSSLTAGYWEDDTYPKVAPSPLPQYIDWLSGPNFKNLSAPNTVNEKHFLNYVIKTRACPVKISTVEVTIDSVPDAGENATQYFCTTETLVPLLGQLAGTPDPGGSWALINTGGAPPCGSCGFGGSNFNPSAVTCGYAYTFEYTKTSDYGKCAPDIATVAINVICEPNPGAGPATAVKVCQSSTTFDLFSSLVSGPQIGGTWVDVDGTGNLSPVTPGNYNANFNPSGTPNTFAEPENVKFDYVVNNGYCSAKKATVNIQVYFDPYAGDAVNITTCETTTSINLYGRLGTSLGTPKPGGVWRDLDGSNAIGGDVFKPNLAANGPGTYCFRYIVNLGVPELAGTACYKDSTTVCVTILKTPEAGSNQAIDVCIDDNNVPLFPVIGIGSPAVDAGGVWSADPVSGLGGIDTSTGVLNPSAIGAPGVYKFIYTVQRAPCPQDKATVTVTIKDKPSSGANNALTICINNGPYELISGVGGSPFPTGTFTLVPNIDGAISNGYLSPNYSGVGVGTHIIRYQAESNVCVAETFSTLTLTIEGLPIVGNDTSVVACESETSLHLTPLLGNTPDISPGVWTTSNSTSPLFGDEYMNPNIQFNLPAASKTYVYTATTIACPIAKTSIVVNVNGLPEAGTNGTGVTCITKKVVQLGDYITGEDLGGTWTTTSNSGGLTDPTFDASLAGLGFHNFTYTVSIEACPDDVSTLVLDVKPLNNAGNDGDFPVCESVVSFPLNDVITNEDLNGVWKMSNGDDDFLLSGGRFSPFIAKEGKYQVEYKADNGACPVDFSYANIEVIKAPIVGVSASVEKCETDNEFPLISILTETADGEFAEAGGVWLDVDGSGGLIDASSGNFSPELVANFAGAGSYKFTYTIDNGVCAPVTSTVTVKIVTLADAGSDNLGYVCRTNEQYNLTELVGALPGGVWSVIDAPNTFPPGDEPNFDASSIERSAGEYTFRYDVTGVACPSAFSIATVMLVEEMKMVDKTDTTKQGPTIKCNVSGTTPTYIVEFSVLGGAGGYEVDGLTMSQFTGSTGLQTFTSNAISDKDFFTFTLSDSINCTNFTIEGGKTCSDFDKDGVADSEDLDDDNDGIPDFLESDGRLDVIGNHDFDNQLNYRDPDYCALIGSGINQVGICAILDRDNDGIINQYDLDSDNDGIFDVTEFLPKNSIWSLGSIDGKVVNYEDDGNGWHAPISTAYLVNDGVVDVNFNPVLTINLTPNVEVLFTLPMNSDNDSGVNKRRKADFLDTDSDNDGIPDNIEAGDNPKAPLDTDVAMFTDHLEDFRDPDSDNDGIEDVYEGRMLGTNALLPRNSDGTGDYDFRVLDADGDGILDADERITVSPNAPIDTDDDGDYDFQDLDSDDDSMSDAIEAGDPSGAVFPANSDSDNLPDYRDLDSDNDKVADLFEAGNPLAAIFPANTDGDALPDYLDLDSDNDNLYDELEGAIFDVTALNGDSVYVEISDTDLDGIFDFRDLDSDNDGISDMIENEAATNLSYYDFDNDGFPNFRDLDSDNDCMPDAIEAGDPTALVFPANSDSDDNPDYLDEDSDNDGILDFDEGSCDQTPRDSDGDDIPDYRDSDSDNDGILDIVEGETDCDSDGTPNYRDFGDNCQILVDVPEGFSPNQDEINDRFVIPDLEKYPQNTLKIYNRWGVMVYEKANYDNSWDGIAENPLYGEEELPVGTYFYMLDLGLDQEPIRGYVYLNR